MSKLCILVLLIAFRIYYHPTTEADSAPAGFVSPATINTVNPFRVDADVISSGGNSLNKNIWLNWALSENETAYALRIEKKEEGKHFKL